MLGRSSIDKRLWHRSRGESAVRGYTASMICRSPVDPTWQALLSRLQSDPSCLVVLDDDPTGCQTVYDINVLLDYSVPTIKSILRAKPKVGYSLSPRALDHQFG